MKFHKEIIIRLHTAGGLVVYTEIPGKYYLKLLRPYGFQTGIKLDHPVLKEYYSLYKDGWCNVFTNYCWNGADKCPDTVSVIRASLEHDPLTQLYKEGLIPEFSIPIFNDRFETCCREDGMPGWQAKFYRTVLRLAWKRRVENG